MTADRIARAVRLFPVLLLLLAHPAVRSPGLDLQEMLVRAVENDARTQALSGVLANTLLAIERANLAPGFQMQLSTGAVRLGYSYFPDDGDPPWQIAMDPAGTLILGRRTETEIGVRVPMALDFGDGIQFASLPKISIRQPLDRLRGGSRLTKVQERQNLYAAEKARLEVLNRVNEVKRSLLSQVAALVGLEQTGRELERNLAEARDGLQRSRELKSFAAGSVQQRQAEFAVSKLEREQELHKKRYAQAWSALERLVGESVDALPAEVPAPSLSLPGEDSADRNPQVYLASLSADVEALRLEEDREPAKPKFYLGAAVDSRYSEAKDRTYTTVGGTLEGVYEDFTATAGIGGIPETGTLFVSAGLSWSFPDRKLKELDRKERENSLATSRWILAEARAAYASAREALALELGELELRLKGLAEERALFELRLSESSRWLEQGFSTSREVADVRWQGEKLDYAAKALQLDSLVLENRLAALIALEGTSP